MMRFSVPPVEEIAYVIVPGNEGTPCKTGNLFGAECRWRDYRLVDS
jgi:hypothetical protein